MFLYHLICICNQLFNYMLLIIYCILLYYTGSKYLWAVQFIRSKTIEPAVQPVLNGWTSEPVNRWPCRFNLRSDPNNMGWACSRLLGHHRAALGLLALLGRLCLRAHLGRTALRGPCSPLGRVSAGLVSLPSAFFILKVFSNLLLK